MNEQDVKYLLSCVIDGDIVMWWHGGTARRITHVHIEPPTSDKGDTAMLSDGSYIALYNCEKKDFIVAKQLFQ